MKENWFSKLLKSISSIFTAPAPQNPPPQPAQPDPKYLGDIRYLPFERIQYIQKRLTVHGFKLTPDGDPGRVTQEKFVLFKVSKKMQGTLILDQKTVDELDKDPNVTQAPAPIGEQHKINPAFTKAGEFIGKGESDSVFVKYLSAFWKYVKLSKYTTIVGTSFAWCALFVVAMNSEVGQKYLPSAGAKNQGQNYGLEYVWQQKGLPKSAVVHINHDAKDATTYEEHEKACKSSQSNHVGFLADDCAASELFDGVVEMYKDDKGIYRAKALVKKGAVVRIRGGNQNNMVSEKTYDAREICEVRWPEEIEMPAQIAYTGKCSGKVTGGSTR